MTQINKARVTDVQIGTITIEGLMLPDGSYAVSLQQLREVAFNSVHPKNALKALKSACGKNSPFIQKIATELNSKKTWIIPIDQLNFCLTELAFSGHEDARNLIRVLAGLSLHQLFCDAFDVKCEKEERQQYLIDRMQHRKQFHPLLTSWLQKDGCIDSQDYAIAVNTFKRVIGVPLKCVDTYLRFWNFTNNEHC